MTPIVKTWSTGLILILSLWECVPLLGGLLREVEADWGDENPVRLTMEGDPVFVPFQRPFSALW